MQFDKTVLENGVRVTTTPMLHAKSVTVMFFVGVGSRYEGEAVQGLSHFLEHMMFKGTEKRPTPLDISIPLEGVGAEFNASTGNELTRFWVKVASEHLPLALDVLIDIFLHSKFREEELERERGVILEERRMYLDVPMAWVWELFNKIAFGDHPLGRPTEGEEETIKAITRRDLLDYCEQYYKPRNIVIALAGAFSKCEVVDEVHYLLGGLKQADWNKPLPFVKVARQKPQIAAETRDTAQTHLVLGVRGYPLGDPRGAAYEVLDGVLGTGMSSRLFTEVREKRGLAYYVGSWMHRYTDAGTLAIRAGVNSNQLDEALKVIIAELQKLKGELVPQEELSKVKSMLKGTTVLLFEDSSFVAEFYGKQEALLERELETLEEWMAKIDAVTAEEVQEIAQELFVTKALNLALIGPHEDPDRLLPLLDLS